NVDPEGTTEIPDWGSWLIWGVTTAAALITLAASVIPPLSIGMGIALAGAALDVAAGVLDAVAMGTGRTQLEDPLNIAAITLGAAGLLAGGIGGALHPVTIRKTTPASQTPADPPPTPAESVPSDAVPKATAVPAGPRAPADPSPSVPVADIRGVWPGTESIASAYSGKVYQLTTEILKEYGTKLEPLIREFSKIMTPHRVAFTKDQRLMVSVDNKALRDFQNENHAALQEPRKQFTKAYTDLKRDYGKYLQNAGQEALGNTYRTDKRIERPVMQHLAPKVDAMYGAGSFDVARSVLSLNWS
ncbi:hypothetical protein ABTY94_37470, partial [Streptomyces sp. NPDC096030]